MLLACSLGALEVRSDDALPAVAGAADRSPPARLDPVDFGLQNVADRSELTFEESTAYYAILDHVRRVPDDRLNQAAAAFRAERRAAIPVDPHRPREIPRELPVFVDLLQSPQACRGSPVRLEGHFLRLVSYAAGPNPFGIERLYEGWLVTEDSQLHPSTIVFTELPAGMPMGESLIDGVSVTGYFFKLHTYASRDDKTRFAPLILARTVGWRVPPTTDRLVLPGMVWWAVIWVGTAGIALWCLVSLGRTRRHRRGEYNARAEELPRELLERHSVELQRVDSQESGPQGAEPQGSGAAVPGAHTGPTRSD
jgi:hypothetical protein